MTTYRLFSVLIHIISGINGFVDEVNVLNLKKYKKYGIWKPNYTWTGVGVLWKNYWKSEKYES